MPSTLEKHSPSAMGQVREQSHSLKVMEGQDSLFFFSLSY
jgi:hypothetical protein